MQQGLCRTTALKVYDCYRPRRAVRAFEGWVREPELDPLLKRFHPNLEKSQLIDLGYIAAVSSHSRGDTVDLTLVARPAKRAARFKPDTAYGSCAGPLETRSRQQRRMGTGSSFDPDDHTKAPRPCAADSAAQLLWCLAQRVQQLRQEWWHFTTCRSGADAPSMCHCGAGNSARASAHSA